MELREEKLNRFLKKNLISKDAIIPINTDASFRRYYRVKEKNLLIMDAPKEKGESILKFKEIDYLLLKAKVSAPIIFDFNEDDGFMLIEDFGENLFSKILDQNSQNDLYKKAVSLLAYLFKQSVEFKINLNYLETYSLKTIQDECEIFIDWYINKHLGTLISKKDKLFFQNIIKNIYDEIAPNNNIIVLRDYHVDNLFFLKERKLENQVGVIDFQDALVGSCAYDLISLLEDVRNPITNDLKNQLKNYFIMLTNCNASQLENEISFFSVQRNLKILGIFSRLKYRDNKDNYMKYNDDAWKFIKNHIDKPIFKDLKIWLKINAN